MANEQGFTLIEVLIAMGIISCLAGSLLFIDINSYRGDAFAAARGKLVAELQTARANALNNIDQRPHTLVLHPDGYDGYAIGAGSLTSVTFEQLSGDVLQSGEIVLIDYERHATTTIFINHEGRIQ